MGHAALASSLVLLMGLQQGSERSVEPNGDSHAPSVSDDGNFIVFESRASNFVAGDAKDTWDVFLFERSTQRVTRISDDGDLPARLPMISGDGRWIVYVQAQLARAAPLEARWTMDCPWTVVLFDRVMGCDQELGEARPSRDFGWLPARPTLSRDGRHVVFECAFGLASAIRHIDTQEGVSEVIAPEALVGTDPRGWRTPFIAASGRFLAFSADASSVDLPAPSEGLGFDYDDDSHVFRRDLDTGATQYVSNLGIAATGYGDFYSPRVSDDGRYVAYDHFDERWMGATNVGFVTDLVQQSPGRLLPVDPSVSHQGGMQILWTSSDARAALVATKHDVATDFALRGEHQQVALRDADRHGWRLVSASSDGRAGDGDSIDGAAADDLSILAFSSEAANLVGDDTNGCADIFLFEPMTARTTRIVPSGTLTSPVRGSSQPNGDSMAPSISRDGEFVVFVSEASNFDEADRGDSRDVFLLTTATGRVQRLSIEPHGDVSRPAISGDGGWIYWWSEARDATTQARSHILHVVERRSGNESRIQGLRPSRFGFWSDARPSISDDGSRLAFMTDGSGSGLPADVVPIAVYERDSKATTIVGSGEDPVLSADGQRVAAISSQALVELPPQFVGEAGWLRPLQHVYVFDLLRGETSLASALSTDLRRFEAVRRAESMPQLDDLHISANGSHVAFHLRTFGENFQQARCALVTDMTTGAMACAVPLARDPRRFVGEMRITWMSPDGSWVLVLNDGDAFQDAPVARFAQLFVHPVGSNEWTPVSRNAQGEFANQPIEAAVASSDGSRIVFASAADNLVPGDTNNARDLFIVDRASGKISRVVPGR